MPGQRTVGQDHDYYQWSPIVNRPVLRWPNNARVALCVIVNLDHFDWQMPADAPVPVAPMGGPPGPAMFANRFPDITTFGQHEYGIRCGVYRVFSVLDKYGMKPMVAMDKAIAENYPFLVKECQRRGVEFVAHGTTVRHLINSGMSVGEESAYIHESIESLAKVTGKRPVGWSGPDFQESMNTPNLLAADGIRYVCDWGNDDQPYRMNVKQGELHSLGVTVDLDDIYIHLNGRRHIDEYGQMIADAFDGLYADGTKTGRMMVLNLHPWVIGMPWRIKYLDKALAHISTYGGVWNASGSEIIDWYKAHSK